MRINDTMSPETMILESRQFLERVIEEISYNPSPPTEIVPEDISDDTLTHFYEKYYISLNPGGKLPIDCSNQNVIVSSYEQQVIDFCQNPRSETRICVLHGHTGVGKSTLIRRVIYYLFPMIPSYRNSFFPLYIRLTQKLADDDPDAFVNNLIELVCQSTYRITRKALQDNLHTILSDLNIKSSFYGRFSANIISTAMDKDIDDWINSYFESAEERKGFLMSVLAYLIREGKTKIILILDDVDRHSKEIHTCAFLALDTLATIGINSIVSMRTSTYESASAKILECRDNEILLALNPETILKLLTRRMDLLRESVRLQPTVIFRVTEYEEVLGKDVVECFCNLISSPPSMKALTSLSNTNMKSVFLKLRLMTKSQFFSDNFIIRHLLERDVLDRQPRVALGKTWIFYHLLLGNYSGTYRRDPLTRKAGLINLFDSGAPDSTPWRHFIRLNLLLHFYKMWRLTRDDDEYIRISELTEKFRHAFGSSVGMSLFLDAMLALIESELIFMGSCQRYDRELIKQKVFSDSANISPAGRFYLENLIHKTEYIYFIKDDIDWRMDHLPVGLNAAKKAHRRDKKFIISLEALKLLMKEEYDSLDHLQKHWLGKINEKDALGRFRDHFSPFGLPDGQRLLFTEAIHHNMSKYIKYTTGDAYPGSKIERLDIEINNMKEEFNDLRNKFILA